MLRITRGGVVLELVRASTQHVCVSRSFRTCTVWLPKQVARNVRLRSLPLHWTHAGVAVMHAGPDDVWRSPASNASDEELTSVYGSLEYRTEDDVVVRRVEYSVEEEIRLPAAARYSDAEWVAQMYRAARPSLRLTVDLGRPRRST